MADDKNRDEELKLPAPEGSTPGHIDPAHELPWPQGTSPQTLGDEFAHADRADNRALGKSFEDPNSLDDKRLGKAFEETNTSRKKKHHVHIGNRKSRRALYIGAAIAAVLFVVVLIVGGIPKHERDKETERRAKEERDKKPLIEATTVRKESNATGLTVPGTTIPLNQAFVYARANGYLQKFLVDIGDHVRKDQLLAVIDAPDLDAQVDQARQQVKQAEQQLEQQKSQLALATVTVERYRVLVTKGVLSRQQGDQQEATYSSEIANVAAAQRNVEAFKANLARAVALQSYEYVRAPFAGVITQRNADVGALVAAGGNVSGGLSSPAPAGQNSSAGGTTQAAQSNNAGSSGSSVSSATSAQTPGQGGPLFAIADNSRLRILVSVPEGYAPAIHTGGHAQLAFQEYPDGNFTGEITRNANSIDQNTRTMLVEVQVDNHDRKLIPGMYVVTTFPPTPGATSPILISGDAVMVRNDTSQVAIVKNGKIHLVPVTLGRDFGTVIEVLNGLQEGDVVVTNVTDDVVEGAQVEVHQAKNQNQKPTPPPQNLPPGGSSQYGDQGITDRNLQGQQQQQDKKGSGAPQKNEQKSQGTSGSKQ